jgi:fibronectin-binding autotransporter adhesin
MVKKISIKNISMVYFLTRKLLNTRQDVDVITSNVNIINGNISSLNSSIGTLSSNIQTLNGNITTINSSVSSIQSNVVENTSTISSLMGNVASISSSVSTIQGNISVLQANIASMPSPALFYNTIVYFGTATNTTQNKLYYLSNGGTWLLANNSNSKGKLLAFAVGSNSSTNGMYLASNVGNLQISVADAEIGDILYVSSTSGEITGKQPAGQDLSLVRQVGFKISANEIKFFLYPVYITPMGSSGYGIATQIGGTSSTITDTHQFTLFSYTALSGTRTFTISVAGLFDILMVGGGGGGGSGVGYGGEGGGGGGAGQVIIETLFLPIGTYDVNVGTGGAESVGGSIQFGGSSGFNLQPVGSAGTLKYEALGGVCGGSSWGGGQKGYHSGGASYRGGYGGNGAVSSIGIYGSSGGSSNGSGNNGGGGGAGGNGSQRTSTTPLSATNQGGGGVGITTTFTGSSQTFGVGGCAGGNSGTVPSAPSANTGSGGAGAISTNSAQSGASGLFAVRFRI